MAKKIVITSGKGGVGKTTITANLGAMISDMGYRVALIDIDFGLNNLDVVMGLNNYVTYDMCDVFEGRCRIKQALIKDVKHNNLYLMPSDKMKSASMVSGQNVKLLLEGLNSFFDYIFLDCPAGIDVGFHRAVACAESAIVVLTPNMSSIRDADKVVSILKSYKLDKINLILNRARGDLMLREQMITPKDAENILKTELIGVLPEEDDVFLSCGYCLPKKSQSYKAYKLLAGNIVGAKKGLFDVTDRYTGFLGSIRRSIKKGL
ncbi:MAG: septum site-determining protein MinD [Clostridia bacterium]|nr:septum site-determining protein MinD [Clostridia bacterium]